MIVKKSTITQVAVLAAVVFLLFSSCRKDQIPDHLPSSEGRTSHILIAKKISGKDQYLYVGADDYETFLKASYPLNDPEDLRLKSWHRIGYERDGRWGKPQYFLEMEGWDAVRSRNLYFQMELKPNLDNTEFYLLGTPPFKVTATSCEVNPENGCSDFKWQIVEETFIGCLCAIDSTLMVGSEARYYNED